MNHSCIVNSFLKQSAIYEYDYGVAVNYIFILLGIIGSITMIKVTICNDRVGKSILNPTLDLDI